jgi:hypothetical protein
MRSYYKKKQKKRKKKPITKKGWQCGSRCRPLVQAPIPHKKKKDRKKKKLLITPTPVAHTYNPTSLGA